MPANDDEYDELARALVETEFDAIERGGLRAEWSDEGDSVRVQDVDSGETVLYNPDDLVRAASDQEVRDAREPENSTQ